MSSVAIFVALTQGFAAQQPLPDEMDLFRAEALRPDIFASLDTSGSMGGGPVPTSCFWYAATYRGGNTNLNKLDMLKASLVGCRSPDDGILDRWANRVNFGVFTFPVSPPQPRADFGLPLAGLESVILGLGAGGGTPMSSSLYDIGSYARNAFSGSPTCRPKFVLLLSDGRPNGGTPPTFDMACDPPGGIAAATVGSNSPWLGTEYFYNAPDMFCAVPQEQNMTTYTVKFGTGSGDATLREMAQRGGGEFFFATNVQELDRAFTSIISQAVARSVVFGSVPATQRSSLFAGDFAYVASYAPTALGGWRGNLKKICYLPSQLGNGSYDTTERGCLFYSPDGQNLSTNPNAVDVWTGTSTTTSNTGGAADRVRSVLGTPGSPPANASRPRRIYTWRPGGTDYVPVQPGTWGADDSWTAVSDNPAFINYLHGYTRDADPNSGDPLLVGENAFGDPIHMPSVLLKYDNDCNAPGECFAVFGGNDGTLHFIDAETGDETSALIPAELWRPNNVGRDILREIDDQPTLDISHRYYLDGGLRLFLDDLDGDLTIDSNETAYLIFSLGRGGRAYYSLPVTRFSGVVNASDNPILPLPFSPGNGLKELQQTWKAPWMGKAVIGGTKYNAAAFASGHVPELDVETAGLPGVVPSPATFATPPAETCATVAAGVGFTATECAPFFPGGYPDSTPIELPIGLPISWPNAIAFRVRFSAFDLDPNDILYLEDSRNRPVAALTGAGVAHPSEPWSPGLVGGWSPWIYDDSFTVRMVLDGNQTANQGLVIEQIEFQTRTPGPDIEHYPTVYIMDLDAWNGATPQRFAATADGGGVLARITRSCIGAGAASGLCVDQGSSPDLRFLTCPISTELTAYTVADELKGLYFGDECGQLWGAQITNNGADISVRRLLSLNDVDPTNQTSPIADAKDWRKVYTKVDVAASTCPGEKVVAVYFGTGDTQRPLAESLDSNGQPDYLNDPSLNDGRDVVGVFWDNGRVSNQRIANLADVSGTVNVNVNDIYTVNNQYGWYWRLRDGEKMLRNPLVFLGQAFYKTFQPESTATECTGASGRDRIYVVNSCDSRPVADQNGDGSTTETDREAWTGNTDIGGELEIIAPKNGKPIVTHGDMLVDQNASLTNYRFQRIPKVFHWRLLRGVR